MGSTAFKAAETGDPRLAGSIPVHLRHVLTGQRAHPSRAGGDERLWALRTRTGRLGITRSSSGQHFGHGRRGQQDDGTDVRLEAYALRQRAEAEFSIGLEQASLVVA
ncbi:MAG: hypothetical protein JWM12_1983 [Ilumatobacteraceae bacterium]|nr:hypothetical protein [Ilumatobacteraceae bacterium]